MIPAIRKFSRSVNSVLLGCATIALMWSPVAAAADPDPYARADDSWITISGKVESVRKDAFMLDYGDGDVLVEMDDGDRVKVTGRIDSDFFESRELEADSIVKLSS